MKAFDEIKPTNATTVMIDKTLVPYLFKTSTSPAPPCHRVRALFIAVCHQLYFAAQVQRKLNETEPLPSLDKKWKVWFPALQKELRERSDANSAFFGISNKEWRRWFASLDPKVTTDIDAFVDEVKGTPRDILQFLTVLAMAGEEEGTAFEHNVKHTVREGDQDETKPRNLYQYANEKLQLEEFIRKSVGGDARKVRHYIDSMKDAFDNQLLPGLKTAEWKSEKQQVIDFLVRQALKPRVHDSTFTQDNVNQIVQATIKAHSASTASHSTLEEVVMPFIQPVGPTTRGMTTHGTTKTHTRRRTRRRQ